MQSACKTNRLISHTTKTSKTTLSIDGYCSTDCMHHRNLHTCKCTVSIDNPLFLIQNSRCISHLAAKFGNQTVLGQFRPAFSSTSISVMTEITRDVYINHSCIRYRKVFKTSKNDACLFRGKLVDGGEGLLYATRVPAKDEASAPV